MVAGNSVPPESFKMTELGPLPEEWEVVSFDETILRTRISVGKAKQTNYKPAGRFPIIDQGQAAVAGYWDNPADTYQGPLPVIVFGDHTRILKFVKEPFVCGADATKVLVPDTSKFDPEFLFYALSSISLPSRGYNRHYHLLREKNLPLPPLPEQRAIAHVLRAVQRAREATERVIAAARELKKSLMRHLFTYGPVPLGQVDTVRLKETEIGHVPEGWGVVRLGEVVNRSEQVDPRRIPDHMFKYVDVSSIERETLQIVGYLQFKGAWGQVLQYNIPGRVRGRLGSSLAIQHSCTSP